MTGRLYSVCARCADAGFHRCAPHLPAAFFDVPGRWLFLFRDPRPPRPLLPGLPIDDMAIAFADLGPNEFLWISREPGALQNPVVLWPGVVRLSTEGGDPL